MTTVRFLAGRLLSLLITLLISSFLIFGALYLAPGSPLSFLTHGRTVSPELTASLKQHYHLDEPFWQQYWHWVLGAFHGNFGTSILYNESVSSLIEARVMNTVWLILAASLLIIVVGLSVGIAAGLRPGWLDSTLMVAATATMAVPAFVSAVVLTLVFGVDLGWLPVFGTGEGVGGRISHLTLPAIALALASVAFVARLTRIAVRSEMGAEHVQTAISRGLAYRLVVQRHVLRNAAVPVVTVAGLTVGSLLAGTVIIEEAFQLNGLGSYLVSAVQQKDFPVVQAICLIYVTAFVVLNTVIDMSYSLLDARIVVGRTAA